MSKIKALGLPNKIKALGVDTANKEKKSLSIRYISCSKDKKYIYLHFEVQVNGLKSGKATIFVEEMNAENEFAVSPSKINIYNGKNHIKLWFSKDKEFNRYTWQDGFVFQATIICDVLSAKTGEFKLIFTKKRENKNVIESKKEYATQADWDKAAKDLGINDPDLLKAIAQQESENIAFLISGKPKILYERHHFYNFYKDKYGKYKADSLSQSYENIIKNKNGGYGSKKFFQKDGRFDNEGYYNYQFKRLESAMNLNQDMAIKSTSFGLFQVLGEYCTYSNKEPKQFFENMSKSEKFQIQAFVNFIKGDPAKKNLPKYLNSKKWEKVASIYNGAKWKLYNPHYAENLEKYYNKKPWKKKLSD